MSSPPSQSVTTPLLIERALNRAGGTPLIRGNAIDLLIDARENFDAWLASIRAAQRNIFLENYIVCDDPVGREFLDALSERAAAGVRVFVIRDWLGCLGNSSADFWTPLLQAGGEVRAYNRPRLDSPFGWLGRDHRKLLVVDESVGYVSGICIASKWLGDPSRDISPWRDTGVAIRGPACAELIEAFADIWEQLGSPLSHEWLDLSPEVAGDTDLRVIATRPGRAGLFRTDQLVATMARRTLWISDAYFIGIAPYVQALVAAAHDGVDVRLLVPGTSNLKLVARMSHAGYRPLLESGIRVFEWNSSMMHAKSAVADKRWARVGSSNLNLSSWLANCELDVAVENADFAAKLAEQFERDLENSTEIVLSEKHRVGRTSSIRPRRRGGSSSRAAAGTLRLVNTVGALLSNRRVLSHAETGVLTGAVFVLALLAAVAFLWPWLIAWPLAAIALWSAISLIIRNDRQRNKADKPPGDETNR